MSTADISIPIVDFSKMDFDNPDNPETQSFLQTWDNAFRHYGFICLTNHGLEQDYQQLYQALLPFFAQSLEEKLKFRIAEDYGHGGFIPQGQESVSQTYLDSKRSRPPDAVESLATSNSDFNSFPCIENGYHTDSIKNLSIELRDKLDDLTIKVMSIMALCLDLPKDSFLEFYKDKRANNDLRIANYLPVEQEMVDQQMRYGEHTDYTGFTFLWRNSDNGLQCLNPTVDDEQWIDIPTLPSNQDALIVNAGDLIQRWTNDYWISNVHRVIHREIPGTEQALSIVYFTGPKNDTRINVLTQSEKVLSKGDVKEDYIDEITAGEHLWRKINASND